MKKKKVYFLDDDLEMVNYLELILCKAGYFAKGFFYQDEFIYEIEKNAPDVVLIDMELNDPRRNGMEVLKEVKLISEDIVSIMLTKNRDRCTINKALNLGANQYICKPVNRKELFFKIENELSIQSKEDSYGELKEVEGVYKEARILFDVNFNRFTKRLIYAESKTRLELDTFISFNGEVAEQMFGPKTNPRLRVIDVANDGCNFKYIISVHYIDPSSYKFYKNWLAKVIHENIFNGENAKCMG